MPAVDAVIRALVIGLLTLAGPVRADVAACTVTDVNMGEGKRLWGLPDYMLALRMDRHIPIRVDTETGDVVHPYFGLTGYANRMVLDRGSLESPFSAIYYSDENVTGPDRTPVRNVAYVELGTFQGLEWFPFHILEGGVLVSGLCRWEAP